MNTLTVPATYSFGFAGATLEAMGSGALWWPSEGLLCVSDLHLGKSERMARHGHAALPPYETQDTLTRLAADLDRTEAQRVICLGDSFDDAEAAAALPESDRLWIARLQAGRDWTWIEGNHDPGPIALGGAHRADMQIGPLTFRHIAIPDAEGEVSGHYHPKARIRTRARSIARPAFLVDRCRLILPAYGTYTGGLDCGSDPLAGLFADDAVAILTGPRPMPVPMPRR